MRHRKLATFAVLLSSVGMGVPAVADTLNVPSVTYPTIQSAVDAAADGDEIVVAPGTYNEAIDFLGKAITLRSLGGADVTTIDGTGLNDSVVKCVRGEGPDTVLAGFTISGGTGSVCFDTLTCGGGMFNLSSSPTVNNCTFIQNTASNGGGMFNNNASPTVTNCIFIENGAPLGRGGGMSNLGGSSPTVTDCLFIGNAATGKGGGMFNDDSSPTVTNCTFSGNSASGSGGVAGGMYNSGSNPTITNCMFSENSALFGIAGGLYNLGSNPVVTNCVLSGNSARYGGGMYSSSNSSPEVTNCTFRGNSAVFKGGGMYNTFNSNPTVTNCTFIGNSAAFGSGGGIHNRGSSSPFVINCTFSGNAAGSWGGGMSNISGSSPYVTNCIFWANEHGEIVNGSLEENPTIRFSVVQGALAPGSIDGGGNIDADPLFVDTDGPDNVPGTEDDNLRLLPGSPCINAGDPGFVPGPTATDLDGHARVLCMRVDMGAYEFGIGDFDCDQVATLTDFADWTGCMGGPESDSVAPGCEAFDFEFDGDVDLEDVGGFQRTFTGQ